MSTYCVITELEMDALFKFDKGWKKDYTYQQELIYIKNVRHLQIKVFSSLNKNNGISAKCGADAIRVCAINTVTDKGIIKTRRINRVPGWEGRLKERVLEVWNQIKS